MSHEMCPPQDDIETDRFGVVNHLPIHGGEWAELGLGLPKTGSVSVPGGNSLQLFSM
jgi:hypothetical protein